MLELGLQSGYAEGGEVDVTSVEIEKNADGTYSAYPIDLSSDMGAVAVELILKQEGDAFKITTIEVDGV
jgi:hypothetical protein